MLVFFCVCSGCAYNQVSNYADNGSTINCTSVVDKPVTVPTDLLRNANLQAPMQGGTTEGDQVQGN